MTTAHRPETSAAPSRPPVAVEPPASDGRARSAAPVCVLGMHRSGTSLVASLVAAAGVDVGRRLVPAAADNPRGYFEDADFVALHDRALARRARTYADPGDKPVSFDARDLAEARRLLADRREAHAGGAWGWKDPRTCLFATDWAGLIPDARFVIVVRHPLEVAASLMRRREHVALASVGDALRLWMAYNRPVAALVEGGAARAEVLEASAVVDDPAAAVSALRRLGLALPEDAASTIIAADEFRRLPGLDRLEPLAELLAPGLLALYRSLADRAAAPTPSADPDPALRAVLDGLVAAGAVAGDDLPSTRESLLVAGLCLCDHGLERAMAPASLARALAAERETARQNFDRATVAEAAAERERASAKGNYDRALAAEAAAADHARAARDNYERAVRAEAAAAANHDRATASEEAARKNYERVLSAEAASKANYERAVAAERLVNESSRRFAEQVQATETQRQRAFGFESQLGAKDAELARANQRGDTVEASLAAAQQQLRSAAAQAESLRARLQGLATQSATAAEQIAAAEARARSASAEAAEATTRARRERESSAAFAASAAEARAASAELAGRLAAMESERNLYRRRWPPYAARRAVQKSLAWARAIATRRQNRRATARFGDRARLALLFTGLPEEPGPVAAALGRQTRRPDRLIVPGAVAGPHPAAATVVHNWWGPDLPRLLEGIDYAVVAHPQYYGAGPLWNPVALEMAVAALASDPGAAAVAFVGAPGDPAVGAINHVWETDALTLAGFDNSALALVARPGPFSRAFAAANPGESRDLRAALAELGRAGHRVLVAPRTFPSDPESAARAASSAGAAQPARPRAAIRALYVTQWLECGGADKGAVDLLTRADPEKVRYSLMTTVASSNAWEPRVRGRVAESVLLGDHLPLPPDRRFPDFLVEYVRRRDIGVVHIMHSFLACDALPRLKAALPRVRVLDQCHILEPPDNMEGGHPAYSTRRYKDYFDHRTVTSRWLKRYLVEEHGVPESRVSVIYTGVDAEEEFNPELTPPGQLRSAFSIPEGDPVVVFLGRLHWQKRPWVFVRAAGLVQAARPGLRAWYVLVGPGADRDKAEVVRAEIPDPDRVVFAGERGHSAPVLRDADLLFMPSGHEGLAYVSYEAMAMGVPQIFTDVNGQAELITPETGVLVPADEDRCAEAGAAAIIALLDDPARRAEMGRAGRERVRSQFGLDVMVRSYERLYAELLRG